jgi:hypothetical protein
MNLSFHALPLWEFILITTLGLLLHVLTKVDAWWKPASGNSLGVKWYGYFTEYPVRTLISVVGTALVAVVLWDQQMRDAGFAAAAGYIGNSLLDNVLGQRFGKDTVASRNANGGT